MIKLTVNMTKAAIAGASSPGSRKYAVYKDGSVAEPHLGSYHIATMAILAFCDRAEEAESARLLMERRREEMEAVKAKYEKLLDQLAANSK